MGPEASDDSGLMTGGLIASVMMWDVGLICLLVMGIGPFCRADAVSRTVFWLQLTWPHRNATG